MRTYDYYGFKGGICVVVKENLYYKDFVDMLEDLKPMEDRENRKVRPMPMRLLNAFVMEVSTSTILTDKEKIALLQRFSNQSRSWFGCLKTSTFNILLLAKDGIFPTEVKVADFNTLIRMGYVFRDEQQVFVNIGGFDIVRTVSVLKISPYGLDQIKILTQKANEVADNQLRVLKLIGKL